MIHRTVLGTMERFLGCLIEHYGGNFPVWLAPVQVAVIPVSEKFASFAEEIASQLQNFRVEVISSRETVSKRIREAEIQRIPYIIVVGEKEKKEGLNAKLPVRLRGGKLKNMTPRELKVLLRKKIKTRSLSLE